MDTIVKINAQSAGRDKLARLFQYLCRLLWHRLQRTGKRGADRLKALEFTLANFRKMLRFGRCIDTLYSLVPLQEHPDPAVRFTVAIGRLNHSLFLLCDHLVWLGRAGLCGTDTDKWTRRANKFWLGSIAMYLARDLYEVLRLLGMGRRPLQQLSARRDLLLDTLKNACDIFIPLTALGYARLSPGATGCLGVVSSAAGILAVARPPLKLALA